MAEMSGRMSEAITLPFVECGKVFCYKRRTSEYVVLDNSGQAISDALMSLYSSLVGQYGAEHNLFFSVQPPGFGNFSTALIEADQYVRAKDQFLFIQLQQRRELEYLPLSEFPNDAVNRLYTQAHFTVIPGSMLRDFIKQKKAIYHAILSGNGSTPHLKDYWAPDKFGKQVLPQRLPRELQVQPLEESPATKQIVQGLSNIVFNFLREKKTAPANNYNLPNNLVVVYPGLNIKERLAIMQEVQYLLLPSIGIFSFSLDYAMGIYSTVYFSDRPADGNYLSRPFTAASDQVLQAAQDPNGYYNLAIKFGIDRLDNPIVRHFLSQPMPLKDAFAISDALLNATVPGNSNFANIVMSNLPSIDPAYLDQLLSISGTTDTTLEEMIRYAPRAFQSRIEKFQFYRKVLNTVFSGSGNSPFRLFNTYLLIRRVDPEFVEIQQALRELVKNFQSEAFKPETLEHMAGLPYELLERSIEENLTFADGVDVLNFILSKPSEHLIQTIDRLYKNGKWTDKLNTALVATIADPDTFWNEESLGALFSRTPVKIPGLIQHKLNTIFEKPASISRLLSFRPEFLAEELTKIFSSISTSSENVFSIVKEKNWRELRKVALKACVGVTDPSFDFTCFWLSQLKDARKDIFLTDLGIILNQYSLGATPIFPKDTKKKVIYDFLRNNMGAYSGSLKSVCENLGVQGYYLEIVGLWLSLGRQTPIADIVELVNELPNSNEKLAELIKRLPENRFIEAYGDLSDEIAELWLQGTSRQALRAPYTSSTGQDLLYLSLLGLKRPSAAFLVDKLTNELGIWKGTNDWASYRKNLNLAIDQLSGNSRELCPVKKLRDLIDHFDCPQGMEREHAVRLGNLAMLFCELDRLKRLPNEVEITHLIDYATSNVESVKETAKTVLIALPKKFDHVSFRKELRPLVLYAYAAILDQLSVPQESFQELTRACEDAYPAELSQIE